MDRWMLVVVCFAGVGMVNTAVPAADPAPEAQPMVDPDTEPTIPERELTIDANDEESDVPLSWAEELMQKSSRSGLPGPGDLAGRSREPRKPIGLLEQRYVVRFDLVVPLETEQQQKARLERDRISPQAARPAFGLVDAESWQDLRHPSEGQLAGRQRLILQSNWLSRDAGAEISRFLPDAKRQRTEDALKQIDPLIARSGRMQPEKEKEEATIKVVIFGKSQDEARLAVETWFTLYDWGVCYSGQKELLTSRKAHQQRIADLEKEKPEKEAAFAAAEKDLETYKEFADVPADALTNLATQRRLLSVDLTGLKARIAACNEMLKTAVGNNPNRREQLESARVNAEIELIGLDAKRQEIDRIISGVEKRQQARAVQQRTRGAAGRITEEISSIRREIERIERLLLGFKPLPVRDNKVEIRRIKWVGPQG